jgi:O-antigen/teichoic acid export membrane protein
LTASTTLTKLLAWRPGGYLRASGALFGWLIVRTAAQTALFVLVARTLGADGYGSLIAVMAVATLFTPLAGMGGQALLVREGARNPQNLNIHLGDALRLWAVSVVPLCALAYALCRLLLPPSLAPWAVAAVVIADLAGASLLAVFSGAWQARQRMGTHGATLTGLIVTRLLAFCTLLALAHPTPNAWAVGYGAATGAYVALAAALAVRAGGRPRCSATSIATLAATGFPFAFAASAIRMHAEANKPILARLDSVASAGVVGAAQRVTDLVLLPIQAMVATLAPRAYRYQAPHARTVLQLGAPCFAVALGGGILVFMAAPWLPVVLGESYAPAVGVVRLLVFLPCLATARMLLTTLLAAQNRQHAFYRIYLPGVAVGLVVTVVLTQEFGVIGAVFGAYVSELTLTALQAKATTWKWRQSRRCPHG